MCQQTQLCYLSKAYSHTHKHTPQSDSPWDFPGSLNFCKFEPVPDGPTLSVKRGFCKSFHFMHDHGSVVSCEMAPHL